MAIRHYFFFYIGPLLSLQLLEHTGSMSTNNRMPDDNTEAMLLQDSL